MSRLIPVATFIAIVALASTPARAYSSHHGGSGNDRASFGSDIIVNENEMAGDIACAFCSVHLHADSHGDVAVLFGSVFVDQDHSIAGDVAVLGGDVSLESDASIKGDLALLAGELHLAPDASVRGSSTVLPGRLWLVVPFAPLLILIGIVWLIVWFVRRNRYPPPYYPPAPRR